MNSMSRLPKGARALARFIASWALVKDNSRVSNIFTVKRAKARAPSTP